MITSPNQYTLVENGVTYGLHKFKEGVNPTLICRLHASGEWVTLAPPTPRQQEYFETHGTKVVAPIRGVSGTAELAVALPVLETL